MHELEILLTGMFFGFILAFLVMILLGARELDKASDKMEKELYEEIVNKEVTKESK